MDDNSSPVFRSLRLPGLRLSARLRRGDFLTSRPAISAKCFAIARAFATAAGEGGQRRQPLQAERMPTRSHRSGHDSVAPGARRGENARRGKPSRSTTRRWSICCGWDRSRPENHPDAFGARSMIGLLAALQPGNRRKSSPKKPAANLTIFCFRANFHPSTLPIEGFAEERFVGCSSHRRKKVAISVAQCDPRCMLITLDPETVKKRPPC